MPKKIDPQLRERAVRLVLVHRSEYPSNAKAIAAVARQRLKAENRALREDVAILKAATAFFVGELDPRNR